MFARNDSFSLVLSLAVCAGGLSSVPAVVGQTFNVLPALAGSQFAADEILEANSPTATIVIPGLGNPVFNTPLIDAISFGRPISEFSVTNELQFSVALGSGTAGDAAIEGLEAGGDIFRESAAQVNELLWDGDGVPNPGVPINGTLGVLEVNLGGDDVYSWDARKEASFAAVWFSLDSADANSFRGDKGGDIVFAPLNNSPLPLQGNVWATAAQLGLDVLGPNTDDVDGLTIFEDGVPGFTNGDVVLYSLTNSSLSFGAGANQTPLSGFSGGDVFRVNGPGSPPSLFRAANALGVGSGELDALDLVPVIPEPATLLLAVLALPAALARWPAAAPRLA